MAINTDAKRLFGGSVSSPFELFRGTASDLENVTETNLTDASDGLFTADKSTNTMLDYPGFENAGLVPDGWAWVNSTSNPGPSGAATHQSVSASMQSGGYAYSGSYGLYATFYSNDMNFSNYALLSEKKPTSPGAFHWFSMWVKSNSSSYFAYIVGGFEYFDANGDSLGWEQTFGEYLNSSTSFSKQESHITSVAPSGAVEVRMWFRFRGSTNNSTTRYINIDDMVWNSYAGDLFEVEDGTITYNGGQLEVSRSTTGSVTAKTQTTFPIKLGSMVSMKAKLSADNPCRVQLVLIDASNKESLGEWVDIDSSPTVHTLSAILSDTADPPFKVALRFTSTYAGDTVSAYIDEVHVKNELPWSGLDVVTVAGSSLYAFRGTGSAEITANAAGDAEAVSDSRPNVSEGVKYSISLFAYAPSASRSAQVGLQWLDANGGVLSTEYGTAGTVDSSGWVPLSASLVAPAGARRARAVFKVLAAANGEKFYIDNINASPELFSIDQSIDTAIIKQIALNAEDNTSTVDIGVRTPEGDIFYLIRGMGVSSGSPIFIDCSAVLSPGDALLAGSSNQVHLYISGVEVSGGN